MPNNNKIPPGEHIRMAVRLGGGPKKVAKSIGRCHQAIGHWYREPKRMEARFARDLSRLSGYRVPVSQMRPDIFGNLTEVELGYRPKEGEAQDGDA